MLKSFVFYADPVGPSIANVQGRGTMASSLKNWTLITLFGLLGFAHPAAGEVADCADIARNQHAGHAHPGKDFLPTTCGSKSLGDLRGDLGALGNAGALDASDGALDANKWAHLGGKRWTKNKLSYCFGNFTEDLSEDAIRSDMAEAVSMWSEVSGLTFVETSPGKNCDIFVEWHEGDHGDGFPFKSQVGTNVPLAHSFPPACNGSRCSKLSGDIHLNDSRTWVQENVHAVRDCTENGICNLKHTLLHEMGHSLGLDHSDHSKAVMRAQYTGQLELGADDIEGIQALYPDLEGGGFAGGSDGAPFAQSGAGSSCQVGGDASKAAWLPLLALLLLSASRRRRPLRA